MSTDATSSKPRGRSKRLLLAILATGGLAFAGLAVTPAQAAAPSPNSVSLGSESVTVVSSSGKKLEVSLFTSKALGAGAAKTGNMFIQIEKPSGNESHSWNFQIPASAVQAALDGTGSVKVSKKIAPFGSISLKFKKTHAAKDFKCGGTLASRSWKGILKGTFFFNTHSSGKHKWGSLGSTRKSMKFKNAYLDFGFPNDNSCGGGGGSVTIPCQYGITWSAGKFSASGESTNLYGFTKAGATHGTISGSRSTNLSKPAHATRSDYATASAKAPKLVSGSGGKATLHVTSPAKGSGTITSSFPGYTSPNTCGKNNSVTYTESSWSGPYAKGRHALAVPADIFGNISLGSAKYASFNKTKAGAPPE